MRLTTVIRVAFALFALPLGGLGQTATDRAIKNANDAQERYFESRRNGVARVDTQKAGGDGEIGSGIVLSASLNTILVLTALHVVKDATQISVTFYLSRPTHYQAILLPRRSDSLDVALLQVSASPQQPLPVGFPSYRFVDNNDLRANVQLYSINGSGILIVNSLSLLSHDGDAQRFEYTSLSVGEGFSGGPVFNTYGNVIGMRDAVDPEGHFAVAIKIDSALQTLEALGYRVPKSGPASSEEYLNTVLGRSRSDNTAAATPSTSQPPLIGHDRPAPQRNETACESGCSANFSDLRLVRQYRSPNPVNSAIETVESVYALPSAWPGPHYLHKMSMVARRTSTQLGAPGGLLRNAAYLAATDRAGDKDCTLVGAGGMCRDASGFFVHKILGPPGGQPETIEIHPRR